MVIASPWRRLVASLLDGLIVTAVLFLLVSLVGADIQEHVALAALLLPWTYLVVFTALYGATPGKMLLGIRVAKSDGRPVDWLTALVRETLGKTLSSMFLYLGYLWAFFHPKRQTWHDLIANTLVVHREPRA
jgi:uncharacterized RDD family membrane protein YckC